MDEKQLDEAYVKFIKEEAQRVFNNHEESLQRLLKFHRDYCANSPGTGCETAYLEIAGIDIAQELNSLLTTGQLKNQGRLN